MPADASELAARIHAGEWVVDLRERTAYAQDHVVGTVNVEVSDSLVTYLAWLIPWGTAGDARRRHRRGGRGGAAPARARRHRPSCGRCDRWHRRAGARAWAVAASACPTTPSSLRCAAPRPTTGPSCWTSVVTMSARNRAITGSHHVPLHELTRRALEVPADRDVWVHCAGGYRASIAASLLVRAGRRPVLIDDDEQPSPRSGSIASREPSPPAVQVAGGPGRAGRPSGGCRQRAISRLNTGTRT
jgi:hydroxyacylglutathione hydrolase